MRLLGHTNMLSDRIKTITKTNFRIVKPQPKAMAKEENWVGDFGFHRLTLSASVSSNTVYFCVLASLVWDCWLNIGLA